LLHVIDLDPIGLVTANAHGAVHFPTHLILEL